MAADRKQRNLGYLALHTPVLHHPPTPRIVLMQCKYWWVGREKRLGCARLYSSPSCFTEEGDMQVGAEEKLQRGGSYDLDACSGEGRSVLGFLGDREVFKLHCSCCSTVQTFQQLPLALREKAPKSNLLCMVCKTLQGLAFATHPTSDSTIALRKFRSHSTLNCPHLLKSAIHTLSPLGL